MVLKPHPKTGKLYIHLKGAPGQRAKPISLRTKNRAKARQLVKDANLENIQLAAQAKVLGAEAITRLTAGRRVSVRQALDAYYERMPARGLSASSVKTAINTLDRWVAVTRLESKPLAAIEDRHVEAFINDPRRDAKYASRLRELSVLRTFLKFCSDLGWMVGNPAGQIRVSVDKLTQTQLVEDETEPLTAADIAKILHGVPSTDFWHAATLIGWHTGLRLFNVATLEWTAIQGERIKVFTTKGKVEVDMDLTPELKKLFARWPRGESRYVFPPQAASILTGGSSTLSQQFRRLCIRLGIEGKSFHGLRHSFAMRSMDTVTERKLQTLVDLLGVDSVNEVRKLLGHAKAKVTMRYLNHPGTKP